MSNDDERIGGRITLAASLILGVAFLAGVAVQAGPGVEVIAGLIGFGIIASAGAIIGAMVGFYNMGRKRGR